MGNTSETQSFRVLIHANPSANGDDSDSDDQRGEAYSHIDQVRGLKKRWSMFGSNVDVDQLWERQKHWRKTSDADKQVSSAVVNDVGNQGQQKASLGEKNSVTVSDLVSDDDVSPKVKETSSPSLKKKKKEKKKKSEK